MNLVIGVAIAIAINTGFVNVEDSRYTTWKIDAPNTLRTPISFVLCSARKAERPYKPRLEIKIPSAAKTLNKFPGGCSAL